MTTQTKSTTGDTAALSTPGQATHSVKMKFPIDGFSLHPFATFKSWPTEDVPEPMEGDLLRAVTRPEIRTIVYGPLPQTALLKKLGLWNDIKVTSDGYGVVIETPLEQTPEHTVSPELDHALVQEIGQHPHMAARVEKGLEAAGATGLATATAALIAEATFICESSTQYAPAVWERPELRGELQAMLRASSVVISPRALIGLSMLRAARPGPGRQTDHSPDWRTSEDVEAMRLENRLLAIDRLREWWTQAITRTVPEERGRPQVMALLQAKLELSEQAARQQHAHAPRAAQSTQEQQPHVTLRAEWDTHAHQARVWLGGLRLDGPDMREAREIALQLTHAEDAISPALSFIGLADPQPTDSSAWFPSPRQEDGKTLAQAINPNLAHLHKALRTLDLAGPELRDRHALMAALLPDHPTLSQDDAQLAHILKNDPLYPERYRALLERTADAGLACEIARATTGSPGAKLPPAGTWTHLLIQEVRARRSPAGSLIGAARLAADTAAMHAELLPSAQQLPAETLQGSPCGAALDLSAGLNALLSEGQGLAELHAHLKALSLALPGTVRPGKTARRLNAQQQARESKEKARREEEVAHLARFSGHIETLSPEGKPLRAQAVAIEASRLEATQNSLNVPVARLSRQVTRREAVVVAITPEGARQEQAVVLQLMREDTGDSDAVMLMRTFHRNPFLSNADEESLIRHYLSQIPALQSAAAQRT